jgi:tetratricopeptide (TPR) repeat protein
VRLIVFYVHPDVIPFWQVAAAVGLLAGLSLVALRSTQRPYLAVGWFWYLGTLLPVSGVVQVGMQARADRYTYLPLVGIFIVFSWGAADLLSRWQVRRVIGAPTAIALTIACGVLSYRQVGYWQDGATLWGHAAAVTAGVPGAEPRFELAKVLAESGRSNEAIPYLDTVIQIIPTWGAAHGLRGMALMQVGRNPEAIDEYMIALRLDPNQAEIQTDLGVVLGNQGRIGEALPHFAEAVRMKPELDSTHVNLGVALMRVGRRAEAAEEFSAALRINPANALARQMLDAIKK